MNPNLDLVYLDLVYLDSNVDLNHLDLNHLDLNYMDLTVDSNPPPDLETSKLNPNAGERSQI